MTEKSICSCDVTEVKDKLSKKDSVYVVDVRETIEFASEKIAETLNHPLSDLSNQISAIPKHKSIYVVCKSGQRSEKAARMLMEQGCQNVQIMQGGLDAWKKKGYPLKVGNSKIWAMDRQVRMGAGSMVLIGVLGFWFIHPGFLFLSVFVACGLIFSAVTNTCGMARMLGKCPWNQIRK